MWTAEDARLATSQAEYAILKDIQEDLRTACANGLYETNITGVWLANSKIRASITQKLTNTGYTVSMLAGVFQPTLHVSWMV